MDREVELWHQGVQGHDDIPELGPASSLFDASTLVFTTLLRIMVQDPDHFSSDSYESLRDEFRKFYIWNQGFSTSTGDLDLTLSSSKNLKATVLGLMVLWVKSLCRVPRVLPDYDWSTAIPKFAELEVLADKINQVSEAVAFDLEAQYAAQPINVNISPELDSGLDSNSDLGSIMSDFNLEDVVEDLKICSESLIDLTPSLECPANDVVPVEDTSAILADDLVNVAEPARSFVVIIKDRYPSTENDLVKRLGEANWERRERLRKKFASASVMDTASSSGEENSKTCGTVANRSPLQSSMDLSRKYQSTATRSTFSEISIFDHNGTTFQAFVRTESVTSFASSMVDGGEISQRRIPSLPEGHEFGSPFQCQICGDTLRNIRNSADWKKHVYSDLEPYMCLFSDCTLGLRTFRSRRDWINHEFQVHRVNTQWWCNICNEPFDTQGLLRAHIEGSHQQDAVLLQAEEVFTASKRLIPKDARAEICPFCLTAPAQTQNGFAGHVGRHLREISLVALPRLESPSDNETDDDDGDGGALSSAASINGSEAGITTRSPSGTLFPDKDLELPRPDTTTSPAFGNMNRYNPRQDEHNVTFEDAREHAILRWGEMVSGTCDSLSSPIDRQTVQEPRDWISVFEYIKEKAADRTYNAAMRRTLFEIQPLPKSMSNLTSSFADVLAPHTIELNVLWGLLYLNIKLSMEAQKKLVQTADWLVKLRRTIERFYNCYKMCDEKQESTLAMIDFFDHTLAIMCDSARFLRRAPNSDAASSQQLKDTVTLHQRELDELIKHLTEIGTYSRASSMQQQIENLSIQHNLVPEPEELPSFPLKMLPCPHNMNFYGRRDELAKIDRYLKWEGNASLRTFSIYGRHGVGKTEVALEYAHKNISRFDAIFWIGCESTLSLRQSFDNIAMKLQLPGADKKGHHEENQQMVQRWLKQTKRRWLMIFDKADNESERILRRYWPIGANGSILIIFRQYYKFMKEVNLKGEIIKPFNEIESWDMLVRLVGDKWTEASNSGQLKTSDIQATKDWVEKLGGLPLSIQIAASLIANPKHTSSFNITESYARLTQSERNLPERYLADRSPMVRNLDALYDMVFMAISKHARDLLSVLALLAPDGTLIELFLPRRQSALNGKLAFVKQEFPLYVSDDRVEVALTSIVNITPALSAALDELQKANLIRWDHRIISVHHIVREAINYHSQLDLQESFNSAVYIVNEAFPKQIYGGTLYKEWTTCQAYITNAVHLGKKFSECQGPNSKAQLAPSAEFLELLSNASWYLYEISDYDLSRKVIDVAKSICEDKESYSMSHLCNTQGSNYYDLNYMLDCRRNWEMALRIRENLRAEPDLGDIAISLHNMGNLEAATGHYDQALAYYKRAVDIRLAIGDRAALFLGTTYLGIGRCHTYYKNFTEARRFLGQAEQLFVRTIGADKYFMANCYYAYGNIEYDEKLYSFAKRFFKSCLSIALTDNPTHPITAAAYYSLGCVEFEMGNTGPALGFLAKARNIAELRSPSRDDGTVARILWKTAIVLRNQPSGMSAKDAQEADQLLARAHIAKAALTATGRAGEREIYDLDRREAMTEMEKEEESFDLLVPGYFR